MIYQWSNQRYWKASPKTLNFAPSWPLSQSDQFSFAENPLEKRSRKCQAVACIRQDAVRRDAVHADVAAGVAGRTRREPCAGAEVVSGVRLEIPHRVLRAHLATEEVGVIREH